MPGDEAKVAIGAEQEGVQVEARLRDHAVHGTAHRIGSQLTYWSRQRSRISRPARPPRVDVTLPPELAVEVVDRPVQAVLVDQTA